MPEQSNAERVASAKQTVKQYAREELGIDLGQMPRDEAFLLILASLIVKLRAN